MDKCLFEKCVNFFPKKTGKKYCSRNCKSLALYHRKSDGDITIKTNSQEQSESYSDFIDPKIDIFISYRNISHYLKLGYNAVINNILNVNISDLPSVSHVRINPMCTSCRKVSNIEYNKYLSNKKRNGQYTCKSCRVSKVLNLVDLPKSEDRYREISNTTYLNYRKEVRRITRKSEKKLLESWNGIDYYDGEYIRENLNLSPYDKDYPSIDHKISILYGFKNNINPEELANINNLCVTKIKINSAKRDLIEEEFIKIFKPQNS